MKKIFFLIFCFLFLSKITFSDECGVTLLVTYGGCTCERGCPTSENLIVTVVEQNTYTTIYYDTIFVSTPQALNSNVDLGSMENGTCFQVFVESVDGCFSGQSDILCVTCPETDPSFGVLAEWTCSCRNFGKDNNQTNPFQYNLIQNYPNPFNPVTKISYTIGISDNVKISVYDLLGRQIAILVNKYENAGTHSIEFDASNLGSGMYFYKIESGNFVATKKMLVIK